MASHSARKSARKSSTKTVTKKAKVKVAKQASSKSGGAGQPVLLSGGNPQIPKGYGDEPVQAYIAAMPDWKKDIGRKLDRLVTRTVPKVRKAVKWNSPFYGMQDDVWFLSFHCFNKYVKVTFLNGGSLQPQPPGQSKYPYVRYLDIYPDKPFDEAQFIDWIQQASRLPGEKM
ncbi:DUF1801 domain-containing protein [Steroidobacter sp. S1-65]|uniref:DUF1801 domain-containing protein n=1 Tax=Steroidobacter gossypii TaxID=2805490 RepID=A0ABS1WWY1_9GAMM|nr:DUF1801 domain-containing protein [Steroidobacter gossypii]MBM0105458.1 DUF1801 domain-containing protein [Steroidobacter gossypii]